MPSINSVRVGKSGFGQVDSQLWALFILDEKGGFIQGGQAYVTHHSIPLSQVQTDINN